MADVLSTTTNILGQQLVRIVTEAIANRGGAQKASALYALDPNRKVFFQIAGSAAGTVPTGKTWVMIEFDNVTAAALADKLATWQPPTGTLPS